MSVMYAHMEHLKYVLYREHQKSATLTLSTLRLRIASSGTRNLKTGTALSYVICLKML